MSKLIPLLFFLCSSISAVGQRMELGYYIDNDGKKVSCLIQNLGWIDNPKEFKLLKSTEGETITKTIADVQEFGIGQNLKFVRSVVKIDRSVENDEYLSKTVDPVFSQENVFLKELVRGKYNLYAYTYNQTTWFFYNKENEPISQLIHKKYQQNNQATFNNSFRDQLADYVSCKKKKSAFFNTLNYKQKALIDYFIEQNKCSKQDYFSPHEIKEVPGKVQVNLKAGAIFSSLDVSRVNGRLYETDFGSFITPTLGVELEFSISPEIKNWALVIEPFYETFEKISTIELRLINNRDSAYAEQTTLNINTGLRKYFSFSQKSRIFVNAGFLLGFPFNSKIELELTEEFVTKPFIRFGASIGYSFSDKLSIEARKYTDVNLSDKLSYRINYESVMVMLGYRLYRSKKF